MKSWGTKWLPLPGQTILGSQSLPENVPSELGFLMLFKAGVTSSRCLLKDLERKMMATPNQTACNAESPVALEEAKVSPCPPAHPSTPSMGWELHRQAVAQKDTQV